MKTIWKFTLKTNLEKQVIQMPQGAEVLRVGMQGSTICLWACFIQNQPMAGRIFQIVGTGQPVVLRDTYIGSVTDGAFEWHIWESK